jgi:hypothetical protein
MIHLCSKRLKKQSRRGSYQNNGRGVKLKESSRITYQHNNNMEHWRHSLTACSRRNTDLKIVYYTFALEMCIKSY